MELALMHVILKTNIEEDYQQFCTETKEILNHGVKELSISPMREYGKQGEVYVTLQIDIDRVNELLDFMSDGWDGEYFDCICYHFTSKIYSSQIDSLYFEIPD